MKNGTLFKVFFAILLAILCGYWAGPTRQIFEVKYVELFDLVGQLFINALTLVIVPLVASSIITGAARLGSDGSLKTLGLKTFGYFTLNIGLAILIACFLSLFIPLHHTETTPAIDLSPSSALVQKTFDKSTFDKFKEVFFTILPPNIVAVAAQGKILGLIVFCLLFGYFIPFIDTQAGSLILSFWQGIFQIMMKITHVVMKILPLGVFGLVAKVIATTGMESMQKVAWFTLLVVSGLTLHMFVVLPMLLRFLGRLPPLKHLVAMGPALFTAFSTSSSAASLPLTIECIEQRARISNRVCSFTIPLGTTLNLAGSALYICLAVLFISHAYGIPLSLENVALVGLMTFVSSFGLAGIPSACLVAVIFLIQIMGLPLESLGLILATERLLDMYRTVVNVFGNTCTAALVAQSEGENLFSPATASGSL